MKKIIYFMALVAMLFSAGCSVSSFKYEDDSALYRKSDVPFKIYLIASKELLKTNPKVYDSDTGTKPELRRNLTRVYPDLFCETQPDQALQVQTCTRYFSTTWSGLGWRALSLFTFGLIPYVCESKQLHRMDFTLPDGTTLQHPFYRIDRLRGSLGIFAIFQLHRLLPDIENPCKDPFSDPVFLRIHANGISRFDKNLLIKNFQNSVKQEKVEILAE